ncbi:tail fiber domain-containing protein [Flavobacterium sp. ALJ2]|uniref:tail fiber domain-containing protein n=1 Tax=Flavobacterium sp. ALJ2 TaxID=2786960 RepID=UPI00189E56E6|nr:tail fiber domain-containing protein [Flavobacterium sp. ALJ2]MBF7093297.1 tail fiber domain-containing protein [Flavobacterium sp. ALJ2]
MRKKFLLFAFALIGYSSNAQIGIGTHTPDASSALDVTLPKKGVLLSRIALTGTTDAVTIDKPANALTVYNTATISDVTPGYYYWSTAAKKWIRVLDDSSAIAAWGLTGNSQTIAGTNFIGTTDDVDLVFKRNNKQVGMLGASNNVSFGLQALSAKSTGKDNVAIGTSALSNNQSGRTNVAIGLNALGSNTTGSNNIALGMQALINNKGDFNIATGNNALYNNEGSNNIATGYDALRSNTIGSKNIGIGAEALTSNTEGKENVVVGDSSLSSLATGNGNSAFGTGIGASFESSGSSNYNTFVGYKTADGISLGRANTIIGANVDVRANKTDAAISLYNNIIIADGSGNQRINVNDRGNVGIGTTKPDASAALDITSTNKGLLMPRVSLTGTKELIPVIASAANSLMVYNTATISDVTPGYYYWDRPFQKWIRVLDSNTSNPWNLTGNDVKSTDFIGTTNDVDLVFKRKGVQAGKLSAINTSFGVNALTKNTIGINNVAIGSNALAANTTGGHNIATGINALSSNLTGENNIASGFKALLYNTKGNSNTGIGSNALRENTLGSNNVAIGSNTLMWSTQGMNNMAIGYDALRNNQGSDNIALGTSALTVNTTGANNLATGVKALTSNITGSGNTAIGNDALRSNTTGSGNLANGFQALDANTTGIDNIAIGNGAMFFNTTGDRNIATGVGALLSNETGDYNIGTGHEAFMFLKTGSGNIGIGSYTGSGLNSGDNNTILGYKTAKGLRDGSANTIIGANVDVALAKNLSNNIIIADGDGNQRINVNDKGNVGLGTTTPDASAALDITSTNKGVLMPRVALKNTTDTTTITGAANSLTVYNTATASDVTPGYYYWDKSGSKWVRILDSSAAWGLAGNSVKSTDFIGTTNDMDLVFKRYNSISGKISADNTSFGYKAFENDYGNIGINNVAIGHYTLSKNRKGGYNVATGGNALTNNTDGSNNMAYGFAALTSNTTGSGNIAMGTNALQKNTTGGYNIATGTEALVNNMGSYNIATGHQALEKNTYGENNVATGHQALNKNTSGSNNVAFGHQALFGIISGNNNVSIGASACKDCYYSSNNTTIGYDTGFIYKPGYMHHTNSTAIGNGAKLNESNEIRLGNSSIGKMSAHVALTVSSDKRYKENIKTMPLGLDFINKIRPVEYIRKSNEFKTKEWGVIAQELQQTLQTVNYNDAGLVQEDGSEDKMLSVRYTDLIAPMIKAMQELSEENKELKVKNDLMLKRIEALEAKK